MKGIKDIKKLMDALGEMSGYTADELAKAIAVIDTDEEEKDLPFILKDGKWVLEGCDSLDVVGYLMKKELRYYYYSNSEKRLKHENSLWDILDIVWNDPEEIWVDGFESYYSISEMSLIKRLQKAVFRQMAFNRGEDNTKNEYSDNEHSEND